MDQAVNVICVGDSITYGSYIDQGGLPYPNQLLTLLGAGNTVVNRGHPAWTLAQLVANFSTDVTVALSSTKENVVILFAGTNDLYFSADLQSNPQPIIDDMVEYIGLAHGVGSKILIATMIQRGSVGAGSMAGYWSARETINSAIMSDAVDVWGADGICNFAGTASQFETQFTGNGPSGWYTDTAHLTGAALAYPTAEAYAKTQLLYPDAPTYTNWLGYALDPAGTGPQVGNHGRHVLVLSNDPAASSVRVVRGGVRYRLRRAE